MERDLITMSPDYTNGNGHVQENPIIDSISMLQSVEGHFCAQINPHENPTGIYDMLVGEMGELQEALELNNHAEIASEVADVILLSIKLATYYGISIEEVLSGKVARNWNKYNPSEKRELMGQGYTSEESNSILKSRWDKSRDKDFVK